MARWRILAIDDEPDILELIEMSLGDKYDIVTLDSGVNSLEAVETFEPDLIILDIMMPKVTGYHIIEVLRNRRDTAKIPVIFLSAKDTIRDQKYGYKLGATIYLTKPFQPDRLVRNIDNIFQHTPPERRPKKWTLEEVKNRLKAIRDFGQPGEAARDMAPPKVTTKIVHRREVQTEQDKIWRG
jgi:DNA-binding response OmpR family regulator